MSAETAMTEEELRRVLDLSGESDGIDCKGPMTWDGAHDSASLAKDIVAFSNSQDGGIIVIGKAERDDKSFDFAGLSDVQAESFETTRVSQFINARFAPPIRLSCCPIMRDGKRFVVIRVAEFPDVPSICTKEYSIGRDRLLQMGAIYIRTAQAESAPLRSIEDWRALIGLSTAKQREKIAALLRSVISSDPITPPQPPEESYSAERALLDDEVTAWRNRLGDIEPGWRFEFYPVNRQLRWNDEDDLATAARSWAVKMNGWEFPVSGGDINAREGVIKGEGRWRDRLFLMSPNGLGAILLSYGERTARQIAQTMGMPEPRKRVIRFYSTIHDVARFLLFLARLASHLSPDDLLVYRAEASDLAGRSLVSEENNVMQMFLGGTASKAVYRRTKTIAAGKLTVGWRDECAVFLERFFAEFPSNLHTIDRAALRAIVDQIFPP